MKYIYLLLLVLYQSCASYEARISPQWEIFEFGQVKIYYRKENFSKSPSPSLQFIKGVAEEHANGIKKAERLTRTSLESTFEIYIHNMDESKVARFPHGGMAYLEDSMILYSYDGSYTLNQDGSRYYTGVHELGHLIFGKEFGTNRIEYNKIISEGMAVWFDESYQKIGIISYATNVKTTYRKTLDYWIQQSDNWLSISELIKNQRSLKEAVVYPQSGAIVKFLYANYGLEILKALYTVEDWFLIKEIENHTGKKIEEIEKDYREFLSNHKDLHKPKYRYSIK